MNFSIIGSIQRKTSQKKRDPVKMAILFLLLGKKTERRKQSILWTLTGEKPTGAQEKVERSLMMVSFKGN